MPINFPNTPALNDEHTVGQITWVWNGTSWRAQRTSAVSSGDTLNDLSDVIIASAVSGQVLKYDGTNWVNAADLGGAGAGISLTDLSVTQAAASGTGTLSYNNTTGIFTYTPPDLSSYQTTAGFNGAIDSHLNQSNPTSGYVLSWNGSDYAWVAQSGGGGIALTDLSVTQAVASGAGTLSYNNTTGVFTYTPPDLSSYLTAETSHADVLVDGDFSSAGIMATDGAGTYSIVTDNSANWNTAYGWGDHSTAGYQTASGLDGAIDSHLNQSNPTSGYVLSWNGSDYAWVDNAGYTDSDVDTHLNQSNPTSGYVLSWNGSDYAWVAQTGGVALTDLSVTQAPAGGTGTLAYNNTTGVFTYTPPDLSIYLTSFTETNDLTSAVTWANVPDVNITQSSVTQHQAALQITESQITDLAHYADSDVDAHLNQSNPTAGYVLSWNGSDYAWIDNTGYTSFNSDFDTRLATKTTTNLAEGTNLYYTDARARASISLTTGSALQYGALTYNNTTGAFTFNPADPSAFNFTDFGDTPANYTAAGTFFVRVNGAANGLEFVADPGYLTAEANDLTSAVTWANVPDVNITQSSVTQHQAALSITESQITDLVHYADSDVDARITSTWLIDEDTMATDSATRIPSQQSVKAYVDAQVASENELSEMNDVTLTSLQNNQFLRYNSVGSVWENVTASPQGVGGSDTYVQFNDGGVFGGDADLTYNKTTNTLSVVNIDMGVNTFNDTNVGQWDTAYGWGDHGVEGYITASSTDTLTNKSGNISQWTNDSGYLTAETDPVFSAHTTSNIVNGTGFLKNNGSGTWSYDNNTYLTAETNDLTSAVTWANVPDVNITQSSVTQHQAALQITESQITDLAHYADSDVDAHLNQSNPTAGFVLSWSGTDYAWVSNAGYTDSDVDAHLNQSNPTSGYVLSWNGSDYAWVAQSGGVALTDLSVGTEAAASGDGSISYNNTTGVFTYTPPTAAGIGALADITGENLADLADVNNAAPTDGQVLTWDNANSYWKPATPSGGGSTDLNSLSADVVDVANDSIGFIDASDSNNSKKESIADLVTAIAGSGLTATNGVLSASGGGGGGGGTTYEEFKINYATDGTLSSTSDLSSGISGVTIDSSAGGDVTVTFTGYTTPPVGIIFYGYGYASNVYNINTLGSTGTTLRQVPGGGSSGSPTAFGSFSTLKIKIRETETGASRSFGTTTHAWIRFTMGA